MKKNNHISDDLLAKYLLGEASDAEQAQVQQWLEESKDNKKQYDELKLIWSQSRHLAASSTIDENEAWARFKQRTEQVKSTPQVIPLGNNGYKWLKIAAVLLLLAGGAWVARVFTDQDKVQVVSVQPTIADSAAHPAPLPVAVNNSIDTPENVPEQPIDIKDNKSTVKNETAKPVGTKASPHVEAKKYICNSTPCPIEICITQTIKCHGDKTAEYATCSTLEPDQSGQINLRMFDKLAQNCSLTVREIKITRVSTGESIILNAQSSPSTAQDLYNYITGNKKGDILAGAFHSDCNDEASEHPVRFDNNNYGHLILQ